MTSSNGKKFEKTFKQISFELKKQEKKKQTKNKQTSKQKQPNSKQILMIW